MKSIKLTILLLLSTFISFAQNDSIPFFKGALKMNRDKASANIQNAINKKLQEPLSDNTEQDWMDAFYSMELTNYKEAWSIERIRYAFDSIQQRSDDFQVALLELCYANFPSQFKDEVLRTNGITLNAKAFAISTEYLYRSYGSFFGVLYLSGLSRVPVIKLIDTSKSNNAILDMLACRVNEKKCKMLGSAMDILFSKKFMLNNTVVYSLQRKNRDFPGITLVKGKDGNFVTNDSGKIFYVPQLARSMNGMPSYISNGNTPQGIFRMDGFDVSNSGAIGPTTNIQLMMPFETSVQQFLKDSSIVDTVWTEELYAKLLPKTLRKYHPLYETYIASACGRTEIIAHGTTVNPEYYKGKSYYPLTPTEGCLATKEIWDGNTGKRSASDQQKLVDAVIKAGGADGYYIVIEIDDLQKPVSINEVLPFIKSAK